MRALNVPLCYQILDEKSKQFAGASFSHMQWNFGCLTSSIHKYILLIPAQLDY